MNTVLVTTPSFSKYDLKPQSSLVENGLNIEKDFGLKTSLDWSAEKRGSVVGIIVGLEEINKAVMNRFPNLKIIVKHGAGVDNIDLESAKSKSIVVKNAPGANARAVAELALGLMIGVSRSLAIADREIRSDQWKRHYGFELKNKTLSLIGCGAIGSELASIANGIGMKVIGYDITQKVPENVELVSFDEAIAQGDYISLHTPLTKDTKHMINKDVLKRMKPTAFLINSARGGLIDEESLLESLDNGTIAGVALDAFENEPNVNEALKIRENVLLTSHIGAFTIEATNRTSRVVADHIIAEVK